MQSPHTRLFLPLLFLVWVDDLLTAEEFNILSTFIQKQDWLTEDEKSFLQNQLNLSVPPTRSELNKWQDEIAQVFRENPSVSSLFELQLKFADGKNLEQYQSEFELLEQKLGILGSEELHFFHLKPTIKPTIMQPLLDLMSPK